MKRIIFWSIGIPLLISVMAFSAEMNKVKIAVASSGKTVTASVSDVAARCPYYLIFDGAGKLREVIDNPYKDVSGGAGPSAADFLAQKGVTIVIAETFGYKMINAMKENGMTYYELEGSAEDVVKRVLKLK